MSAAERDIRGIVEGWAEAVRAKDVDRLTAAYARDVTAFDAVDALRLNGLDAIKAGGEAEAAELDALDETAIESYIDQMAREAGTSTFHSTPSRWATFRARRSSRCRSTTSSKPSRLR